MPDPSQNIDPPLVDVKVTNPVTYIKKWWNKVIGNEGMEFRFTIRPLTAIAIAIIVSSIAFGVGRFVLPFTIPFFKYNDELINKVLPTPEAWRDTAFTGTLQYTSSSKTYYLQTTSSAEAITLNVPENIDLNEVVGQRIFAAGRYNKSTRTLVVTEASSLEVLPKKPVPVPTDSPTPAPTTVPSPTPIDTLSPN